MVQMFDAETDAPLRLPDGSDRLLLDTVIHVDVPAADAIKRLDYTFGNGIELWCKSVEQRGDELDITLYWHAAAEVNQDLTTFVHGLDDSGAIVEQADKPPIIDYPTSYWRRGQTLASHYTLPANPKIQSITVGLYNADTRLTVTDDGEPLPDNRVILPLLPSDCTNAP